MAKIFQSLNRCSCSVEEDPWREGVDEFYNGCRSAANLFHGKAFEIADNTLNSLQQLITKLSDFTDSNSTIISSSATDILESLSKCNKLGKSGFNIIVEYIKVFPTVVRDFNRVANNLYKQIGGLTRSFTSAVSDLGSALTKYMREFVLNIRLNNCKEEVDYTNVLQKYQDLSNIVALIDKTLLNEEEVTKEVYESVLVLHLLYIYMGISVTGINSCALDAENERNCNPSECVKSCVLSFEFGLLEILRAVSAVVVSSIISIINVLKVVVNIVAFLNTVVEDILGLTSDVVLTVGDIVQNLLNGNKGTASAAIGSSGILNGLLGN